ncbi:MAG: hypothetical protein H7175_28365 [Burkholderiales bacterium]|nr:hypothetical protein [Anaerolineae bacterium]
MKQNLNVLYMGDIDKGRSLTSGYKWRGWQLYLPADAFEALAMTVLYVPDVVVIDSALRPTVAFEMYYHLRLSTFETRILVLSDKPQQWNSEQTPHVRVLPLATDCTTLAHVIIDMIEFGQLSGT